MDVESVQRVQRVERVERGRRERERRGAGGAIAGWRAGWKFGWKSLSSAEKMSLVERDRAAPPWPCAGIATLTSCWRYRPCACSLKPCSGLRAGMRLPPSSPRNASSALAPLSSRPNAGARWAGASGAPGRARDAEGAASSIWPSAVALGSVSIWWASGATGAARRGAALAGWAQLGEVSNCESRAPLAGGAGTSEAIMSRLSARELAEYPKADSGSLARGSDSISATSR